MSLEILKFVAKENQIFSFDQLHRTTGIKREILKVMLSRLEERGFIERIEKGKYMIIPLGSEKGRYTLHEFVIASCLVEPYAISYWSALHYYGFTEQMPGTVFIQTPARKKKSRMNIFGVDYQLLRVNENKFFGLRKEWIEDTPIIITDREKTIVDCLDKPKYAGGIVEVAKALHGEKLDYNKLAGYAQRMHNSGVTRRLGYLCDHLGVAQDFPDLPLPRSNKYLLLDPTMQAKGRNDPKWRLIINTDITDLETFG